MQKLLALSILLLSISSWGFSDPVKNCSYKKGMEHVYLSALDYDVAFVITGDHAPERYVRCNYALREFGQLLETSLLYCTDGARNSYGPYKVGVKYLNDGSDISHEIAPFEENDLGLENFRTRYSIQGRKGSVSVQMVGHSITGNMRCN